MEHQAMRFTWIISLSPSSDTTQQVQLYPHPHFKDYIMGLERIKKQNKTAQGHTLSDRAGTLIQVFFFFFPSLWWWLFCFSISSRFTHTIRGQGPSENQIIPPYFFLNISQLLQVNISYRPIPQSVTATATLSQVTALPWKIKKRMEEESFFDLG